MSFTEYIGLSETIKKFIIWSLDKFIHYSNDDFKASTYHAMLRIAEMSSISPIDSESGYILDALNFVYTNKELLKSHGSYLEKHRKFSDYFRKRMSLTNSCSFRRNTF